MTFVDRQIEQQRQRDTGDDSFFKQGLYFFELRIPPGATVDGKAGSFFYPLVIAPQNMTVSEPFALNKEFTLGGGLYVEENGILARTITVTADAGFRPKKNPGMSGFDPVLPPEKRSHTRVSLRKRLNEALSGQRHFQYLQDNVFRLYADLKNDPSTSKGTALFFHVTRDNEKWRVFPEMFDTQLTSDKPLQYPHTFKLTAVSGDDAGDVPESEDKPVLDVLKTQAQMLRHGIQNLQAIVDDLTGVQNELTNLVRSPTGVLTDIQGVVSSVSDFLDGTQDLISTPRGLLTKLSDTIGESLTAYDKAVTLGASEEVPGSVLNAMRRTQDALYVLLANPGAFVTPLEIRVDNFNHSTQLSTSQSKQALQEASQSAPPNSMREWAKVGTGLTPGDSLRASAELGLGQNVPRYTGAKEVVINQGDTLELIAGRWMGDARRWKIIAIFNGLQHPFISDQGLPGTLTVGDKLLVPDFSKPTRDRDTPATLGTRIEQPAEEHVLGVDFELTANSDGFFDMAVDVEGGSTDAKTVRGRDCLAQALRVRVATEQGTDLLYLTLGIQRVIGVGLSVLDEERQKFAIVGALTADPRVADVVPLDFGAVDGQPDHLNADLEIRVRGIAASERLQVTT